MKGEVKWRSLLWMSLVACFNEAAIPLWQLLEVYLVLNAHHLHHDQTQVMAAYSLVQSTSIFINNITNFAVVLNVASVGKALGEKAWGEVQRRICFDFFSKVFSFTVQMENSLPDL